MRGASGPSSRPGTLPRSAAPTVHRMARSIARPFRGTLPASAARSLLEWDARATVAARHSPPFGGRDARDSTPHGQHPRGMGTPGVSPALVAGGAVRAVAGPGG